MSKKMNLTFSRNFTLGINRVFDKISEAETESALAAAVLPKREDGESYGQWIDRVAPIKKTLDYAGHTKLAQDARKEAQSAALDIVPERMICAIKGTFEDMPEITETGSDKILAEYKIGQKTVKEALREWMSGVGVDCTDETAFYKFVESFLRYISVTGKKGAKSNKTIALEAVKGICHFAVDIRKQWYFDEVGNLLRK